MRSIFPIFLIVLSAAAFFMFVNPTYQEVQKLRADSASYADALSSSGQLQEERDALSEKYRALKPEDLDRLKKLLPDNADNIRLIITIQQIAQRYGMAVSSIKFDAGEANQTAATTAQSAVSAARTQKDYGIFDLEFTTTGSYANFQQFLKELETSLRIVDIQTVNFNSESDSPRGYTYTVKLRTYWLKA